MNCYFIDGVRAGPQVNLVVPDRIEPRLAGEARPSLPVLIADLPEPSPAGDDDLALVLIIRRHGVIARPLFRLEHRRGMQEVRLPG
jgi:hypothetical protein